MCPAMIVIADKTVYIRKGNSLCMWIIYLLVLNGGITSMLCILHELWCGIICLPIGFRRMRIVCYPRVFFFWRPWYSLYGWMYLRLVSAISMLYFFVWLYKWRQGMQCIYIYIYLCVHVFKCIYLPLRKLLYI